MMNSEKDYDFARAEVSGWIDFMATEFSKKEIQEKTDLVRKYYVYALCEKKDDGSLSPFYIGKGTGDRTWNHADEAEKEKKEFLAYAEKNNYSDEVINQYLETISAKHKKINELKAKGGDKLSLIIIKSGLTEYESFMCESSLINIFRLQGMRFSGEEPLTNKVNGHSSYFEKYAGINTAAMSFEQYYENYCKEPIIIEKDKVIQEKLTQEQFDDFKGKKIALINIKSFYQDCIELFPEDKQNEAIREAARGFWKCGTPSKMDYVFAMCDGRIKGVYKVNKAACKTDNFFSVIDLWRENIDYPSYAELPGRKKDYDISKAIFDDLLSQGIISKNNAVLKQLEGIKGQLYSKLSDKVKKIFKDSVIDDGYEVWLQKKRRKEKSFVSDINTRALWLEEQFNKWLKEKDDPEDPNKKLTFSRDLEGFLNNKLSNWIDRRYFVLEDISEEDPDFSKYINCSVLRYPAKKKKGKKENDENKKEYDSYLDQNPVTYLDEVQEMKRK